MDGTKRDLAVSLTDVHFKVEGPAGEVNILRGVDMAVPAGETLGVIGPSGSGKTTLMMVIGGLERPTAGRVAIAGRDLTGLSEDDLAVFRRERIGVVFQAFHLIPTMTALENVAIPMELAGDREAFEKARAQLEAVGLGARIDHYPTQLSGGEQQRTALARAFAIRPDLLLADEPTGNLDQDTGAHIMELMFELKKTHGTTLVLVTHDRSLAQSCDRVVGVRDGKVHDLDLGSGNASAGADAPPISLADAPDTAATLVGAAS